METEISEMLGFSTKLTWLLARENLSIARNCMSDDFHEDEESTFKMEEMRFPKHWQASVSLNNIMTRKSTIWMYKGKQKYM
jgi:hypothetical protein